VAEKEEAAPNEGKNAEDAKPATVEDLLHTLVAHSGPERTLTVMLQIINGAEARGETMELGITLMLGGRLMTGQLIGAKQYYKEFGEQWTRSLSSVPETQKQVADSFAAMGEESSRAMYEATERLGPYDPRLSPIWINLKNVKILYPLPEANLRGPFRVRVSAIEALTIGGASTSRS
jgi:hypothetical protein